MSTHKYENLSEKFLIKEFNYQKQFSHLYSYRLAEMTSLMRTRAIEHWGPLIPIKKLGDMREDAGEECIIIGTIYKHQTSILDQIWEETCLAPQPRRPKYSNVILEDKLQRVQLHGNIKSGEMTTGVVCAVRGIMEEYGSFNVLELIYYESGTQNPIEVGDALEGNLILISGLDWVNSHQYVDSLNLLQHWLRRNLPTNDNTANVRLILAGNSVRSREDIHVPILHSNGVEFQDTIDAMRNLDACFTAWSSSIAVDIMPGPCDPANFMMPQQPFHTCMFPKASKNENFQCVPSPYACYIDKVLIMGTSGENIKDIMRCTDIEEPIDALKRTLQWGHLAPTAPDTLACYPYIDSDPFIMKECPHVYFAGNCDEFSSLLHKGSKGQRTCLVCIPSFSKTQSIAVVNLKNLDCYEISFNSDQNDE